MQQSIRGIAAATLSVLLTEILHHRHSGFAQKWRQPFSRTMKLCNGSVAVLQVSDVYSFTFKFQRSFPKVCQLLVEFGHLSRGSR